MANTIRAIVTGVTGMVGEGVLHECLLHPNVSEVLVVGRKPCGVTHPKLKEVILKIFFDVAPIQQQLAGYNACFFCLGVSSVGMKEPEYYKLTYTLTMSFAQAALAVNKDMTFCYISGTSTDSTEKGRSMWARVKGKTENDLAKMGFAAEYNFRPGYMHPTPGLKNVNKAYKYISWMYPFFKVVMPNRVSTLKDLAMAMINTALHGYDKNILEVPDIKLQAKK